MRFLHFGVLRGAVRAQIVRPWSAPDAPKQGAESAGKCLRLGVTLVGGSRRYRLVGAVASLVLRTRCQAAVRGGWKRGRGLHPQRQGVRHDHLRGSAYGRPARHPRRLPAWCRPHGLCCATLHRHQRAGAASTLEPSGRASAFAPPLIGNRIGRGLTTTPLGETGRDQDRFRNRDDAH